MSGGGWEGAGGVPVRDRVRQISGCAEVRAGEAPREVGGTSGVTTGTIILTTGVANSLPLTIGVETIGGARSETTMPSGASSMLSASVKPLMPHLLAELAKAK